MNVTTPNTQILIDGQFNDFSLFKSSVSNWELDFTLLKRGFSSKLYYALTNNSIFGRVRFNCDIEQSGNCPVGMRTFVVPASPAVQYTWREFKIDANTLQLFPKNGELYSVSNTTFDNYVISFPEEEFVRTLANHGVDENKRIWDEATVWKISDAKLQSIINLCRRYENGWQDEDSMLLHMLVGTLVSNSKEQIDTSPERERVVRGIRYLKMRNFEISDLGELVDYCQCSERSLQYAFKSFMGISPMNYVKRGRLKSVFYELESQSGAPISDIANKYGFWHMGQFASDFRKVYGRLPSEFR